MISSHVQCMALLLAHGFLFFFNDAAPTEIYTLSLHDALRSSVTELRERLQAALGEAYRIEKELGGGGMSHVFLAVEVRSEEHTSELQSHSDLVCRLLLEKKKKKELKNLLSIDESVT